LCPSYLGIDTQFAEFVVGRGPSPVTVNRLDHGVEIDECDVPTLALRSHSGAEVSSRPLPVWIL